MIDGSADFEKLLYQAEIDYLTAINFQLFGSKVFAIAPNLVEHLAHTELNVPSEYIRPPFKSCLFVFDDPVSLEAFYRIHHQPVRARDGALNVFINERPSDEGLRTVIFLCVHASASRTHMLVKRQLLVRPDWDITKMLKTDWADLLDDLHDPKDESRFYEDGLQFFRIVLNSILYLGSNDPDVIACLSPRADLLKRAETSPKWKKLRKEADEASELPYALVGSRLGMIDVAKPSEPTETAEGPKIYRIGTRFMVRGHWRQQPVGPARTQRRLTWIRPYFKGPEIAELINRPYTVR